MLAALFVASMTYGEEKSEPLDGSRTKAYSNLFWRVKRSDNGKWWAVSPEGKETFLRGVDHAVWDGHNCEALNKRPYRDEMAKKFSSRKEWAAETVHRLKSWGFNALGANSSKELHKQGLAHCEFLGIGEAFCRRGGDCALGAAEGIPGTAFPNVFHPEFAKFCDEYAARRCTPLKDDATLFGYFFDNELAWYGRSGPATGLYDAAASSLKGSSAHKALADFLTKRGLRKSALAVDEKTKKEFIRLVARYYFKTISEAIKRHDPNHLLLGCRFAGLDSAIDEAWIEAGIYCDVVSFNNYPWVDLDENVVYLWRGSGEKIADAYKKKYALAKKPLMITEWGFIGLDSGLPCTGGYGQRFRTQAERAQAAELFSRTLLALPFMVGYNFFMWVDEPAQGISKKFPENSNYGLVDGCGKPYMKLTEMFSCVHRKAEALHAAGVLPIEKKVRTGRRKECRFPASESTSSERVVFNRNGDKYELRSRSGLILIGRVGGRYAFESVVANGLECGPFTFMVYHGDWKDIERIESIKWLPQQRTLRISGVHDSGQKSFRVIGDIMPFSNRPWFACNIVSVDNLGTENLNNVSVWLRQYAPWAKDSGRADAVKQVPDLWKRPPSGVWIRTFDGAWCGAATFASTVKTFNYYTAWNGSVHPDAEFAETTSLTLLPGASWKPERRVWMVAAAGEGGSNGWLDFIEEFSNWWENKK